MVPTPPNVPTRPEYDELFLPRHRFQDDIHGFVRLSTLERDVVDTPEFQRLFRISQLGFVDLVYPTATHSRGAHSIGACHLAQELMDRLVTNHSTAARHADDREDPLALGFPWSDRVLIRLGALLHDISHGPFSHDIETKKHVLDPTNVRDTSVQSHYGAYPKHDNVRTNPALFVLLTDTDQSLLARVLRRYSPHFAKLLTAEMGRVANRTPLPGPYASIHRLITAKARHWQAEFNATVLPHLLFHLLACEDPAKDGKCLRARLSFAHQVPTQPTWGLGCEGNLAVPAAEAMHDAWYQPYRHDIIGDTLSADLLDYLQRDCARLGMGQRMPQRLLEQYVLTSFPGDHSPPLYRPCIDVKDYKRGTLRVDSLNDLFRLLDIRHEIHEKAVTHRMVHSATAMLSRAMFFMRRSDANAKTSSGNPKPPSAPSLQELYFPSGCATNALAGDEAFLARLLQVPTATHRRDNDSVPTQTHVLSDGLDSRDLIQRVAERRLYRPLMVIPSDRLAAFLNLKVTLGEETDRRRGDELKRRAFAAMIDSQFYSPFLLFVSDCIENLLRYCITDQQIWGLFKAIADNTTSARDFMACAPKRVILWTTPYKQLHKDPRILVAADPAFPVYLDEATSAQCASTDPAFHALRQSAPHNLAHFDEKYASMWKAYLFISDGLFSPGMIATETCADTATGSAEARAGHEERLGQAHRLMREALAVAHEHLESVGGNPPSTSKCVTQARLLASPIPETEFQKLCFQLSTLGPYLTARQDRDREMRDVSTVWFGRYVHDDSAHHHGDPADTTAAYHLCRDIRWKTEHRQSLASHMQRDAQNQFQEELVHKHGALKFGSRVSHAEAMELLARFQEIERRERCTAIAELVERAQRQPTPAMRTDFLRSLLVSAPFLKLTTNR